MAPTPDRELKSLLGLKLRTESSEMSNAGQPTGCPSGPPADSEHPPPFALSGLIKARATQSERRETPRTDRARERGNRSLMRASHDFVSSLSCSFSRHATRGHNPVTADTQRSVGHTSGSTAGLCCPETPSRYQNYFTSARDDCSATRPSDLLQGGSGLQSLVKEEGNRANFSLFTVWILATETGAHTAPAVSSPSLVHAVAAAAAS